MQKTLILQRLSEDDRFTTCSLPTISISCEAVKKNISLNGWMKQLLATAWKSTPTKAKSSSIWRPSTVHLQKLMDEWKSARRSGPVQILRAHKNTGWNTIKRRKGQTGTSTLSDHKASNTVEKQSHHFSHKDKYLQITCLINTALWM